MSIVSDVMHGSDTNNIGNYILNAIKAYPNDKDNIKKLLLPLYDEYIAYDEGNCRDVNIENKIREILK
jgi:hypothetical protein